MMNTFVVANPNKCIGCRTCEVACVVAHSEKNIFTQEGNIEFNPRLSVVKTAKVSAPIQCRHCEDAPCVSVCPKGAITNKDGVVYIDKNNCIGCKACLIACPVGAIDMVPEYKDGEVILQEKLYFKEKMVANKCDLCMGIQGGPACVKVCPTDAFEIIKSEDIEKSIRDKRKQVVMELANMI